MIKVKICGVTDANDARTACDLGAYAIGLNFYDKSPRAVSPAQAWRLRRSLPSDVAAVGVFVNWQPAAVTAFAQALQLSAAQLHGDESPKDVASCAKSLTVFKAFRVTPRLTLGDLTKFRSASAFLLDAARAGQYGGTGNKTDWDFARRAAATRRIILAGGLTPENVADAILYVHPHAVDVASGVESRPGKKDHGKMREFFQEVARANGVLAAAGAK